MEHGGRFGLMLVVPITQRQEGGRINQDPSSLG
jgi:hypothetical protein